MQVRDRGRKAQSEAEAGPRARAFQAHEALDHPLPVGFGNAGTAIGDGELDEASCRSAVTVTAVPALRAADLAARHT